MIPLRRILLPASLWLGAMLLPLGAQVALGPAAATTPPPGPLPEPRWWSLSTRLDTSIGYKDNVLLSADGEERSAFARANAEVFYLYLPPGRFEYSLFAEAERTQYFSSPTVDAEARVWVETEPAYRLTERLKVSLPVRGYYYDEVYDASESEFSRDIVEMKLTGIAVGPTLRWHLHRRLWLEGHAFGDRKTYEDSYEDSQVGEGSLRLGWEATDRLVTRLAVTRRWRDYDERVRYTASGRPISGTHLKATEEMAELRVGVTWDESRRWTTTTRVSALRYRDNGSGYFSYHQGRLVQDIGWQNALWRVRGSASANRLEWDVQTVGIAFAPPARIREEYAAELSLERKLGPRWTLVASYRWERSRSNEAIASYRVNEGLLGARWSWEK